ncbi:SKP1-like protein 7 [Chenopodium quinoa]|uniref:SKP1-like protein 7 n=1 Tax=Chenopodium quinoa TaxID=63459 RepID=UPI000B7925D8|nr:SKP1-like protein 7 [Chenopodium quinoa]
MSSSSMSNKRKIKLRSSDGKTFEVEEAAAMQSETIKSMIEVVSVSEVNGKTLSLVIDYFNKCLDHQIAVENNDDLLIEWALHLFRADQAAFLDLILCYRILTSSSKHLLGRALSENQKLGGFDKQGGGRYPALVSNVRIVTPCQKC